MTQEDLKLNLFKANDKGELTVIHRTDDAKIVHKHTSVQINGVISAPGNFIEVRKEQDKYDRSHITYSYRDLCITLTTRENLDTLGTTVTGKLIKNPDLDKLYLNSQKVLTSKELTQLLKFNRVFFADKDENGTIVSNLQKLKISAQQFIEKEDASKGSEKEYYELKVDNGLDLKFTLNMPVFIGQPSKKFLVEVCYRIREKNVEFWLESIELADLLKSCAEEIINTELKRFPEAIVKIEQ